jgi:hypothetical protein
VHFAFKLTPPERAIAFFLIDLFPNAVRFKRAFPLIGNAQRWEKDQKKKKTLLTQVWGVN